MQESKAQELKTENISIKTTNQSIEKVLNELTLLSGFKFIYSESLVGEKQTINLNQNKATIDKIINEISRQTNLSFQRVDNTYSVSKTNNDNTGPQNPTVVSPIKIRGVIYDQDGEPVIGASIVVKGTSRGTVTDIDGNFNIDGSASDILSISYVGYTTTQIKASTEKALKVTLKQDVQTFDEVVVIGYGSVRKKDVTTSVSIVSTKDLAERPITSAAQAIQGKAAGVTVVKPSGEPGAGLVVRIRGSSSINASNDPLYVVDGVPMSEINFLSPNDIESMQILKDASSAAIYGSRASNGVVLITTKAGTKGEAKINFSSYLGISNVSKQMQALNVSQYRELMNEIGSVNLPEGLTDQTNWFDETYRTGLNQNYQLSLSDGNEKMKYYISGGYTHDQGIIKVAYYQRYNMRANLENQIRPWLKMSTNIAYSDYSSNGIVTGQGANRAGVVLSVINTPTYATIWNQDKPEWYYNNFYGANITHPVENMSRTQDNKSNNNRLVGSANAEITFSPPLKFKSSIALDRAYSLQTSFLDPIKTAYGRSEYGNAADNRSLATVMVFDNIMTFNKSTNKHNIELMAGSSGTTSVWSNSYQSVSHFLNSDIKTLNAGNKVSQANGSSQAQWSIMSYLSRASYNFDSKYLLSANFRADGSSKLAPNSRWGYFPSLSGAWRISSEPFMANYLWIDDLKLRGGWGQTGNQSGIGDYAYLQRYEISRQNWWEEGKSNAMITLSPANMKNQDLTWETTSQSNIGIDLTILNNRLSFSVDAYYKYTKNLLMDVPLPSTSSVNNIIRNEGEMINKGVEFGVASQNMVRDFLWTTDFNISINRNEVKRLSLQKVYYFATTSEATSENVVRMTQGKALGMFWGYISDGVDPATGNILYRDINQDGKITTADKTYIGNPNPDFTIGLTNNFSYKNFNLNIFLQGSVGNDIYNASRMETEGMYDYKNQTTAVLDRWKTPGQITNMPRATSGSDNLKASSRFVEDGSYLRIKNMTISYNIKHNLLRKWKVSKLQPYITAENLITFTKYKGFDPEVNQWGGNATVQGIDWGTYPQVKTFIVGINLEF
ncbi:SusC/RagA family TonB-linked outer membrane protein [Bacteroidales bacterium]|nr:SusC/RagA family TonB-linked outer membrane protein [Bacteroidales bacterium]